MQFNQDLDVHNHVIRSYSKGQITIVLPLLASRSHNPDTPADGEASEKPKGLQQEILTNGLVVTPKTLQRDWRPQTAAELMVEDVAELAALKAEVVIIGTGERLQWPSPEVLRPLIQAGIGYEIMDTAAACRTYNILSHEGREVAAALMMI